MCNYYGLVLYLVKNGVEKRLGAIDVKSCGFHEASLFLFVILLLYIFFSKPSSFGYFTNLLTLPHRLKQSGSFMEIYMVKANPNLQWTSPFLPHKGSCSSEVVISRPELSPQESITVNDTVS